MEASSSVLPSTVIKTLIVFSPGIRKKEAKSLPGTRLPNWFCRISEMVVELANSELVIVRLPGRKSPALS